MTGMGHRMSDSIPAGGDDSLDWTTGSAEARQARLEGGLMLFRAGRKDGLTIWRLPQVGFDGGL